MTSAYELAERKLADHASSVETYIRLGEERVASLEAEQTRRDFQNEMRRFLPVQVVAQTVDNPAFWGYVVQTVMEHVEQLSSHLGGGANYGGARCS